MKNDSSEQKSVVEVTQTARRAKKVIVPPKSPKLKAKKPSVFMKRLKEKITPTSKDLGPLSQSLPDSPSEPQRPTPEGHALPKSVSDDNLCGSAKKADREGQQVRGQVMPERAQSLKDMPAYGDLIVDPVAEENTSYANRSSEKKDHLYKILVIGDLGAGKTSIIKRYVHRFFTQHYRATIGVDFALKVLNWDENTLIRLQLWDIAGQERYGNMTRVYYKEAVGAFIVFDVTRVNTFESVAKWKSDLDSKVQLSDGSPIPCVLLANKCDQPKEGLVNNSHKMDEYCKDNNFTAWFETSAKDNINIDEAARALVSKILENDALLSVDAARDDEKFAIAKEAKAQKNGKMCSC